VHRIGDLAIGEMAVWVGVSARHRAEAFQACRYIIDEVKHRVPIWKKEHYENGDSGWVNCERCAAPVAHEHQHDGHPHATASSRMSRQTGSEVGVTAETRLVATTLPEAGLGNRVLPDYSRQMALKEVGAAGQARLRASRVLVIGCGGLGVPVISYLAGAGIGRLGLVDGDRLEPSNLHRQTLYSLADVGKSKAELAADRVRALNPDVDVRAYALRLDALNAADLIAQHDLVIDCTDNFSTKFLLNDFCVQLARPVIFASVYQYEGQVQVVRPGSACLRCVWPEATRDGIVGNCSEAGVLGPVPGIFGALQAFEALRLLLELPGQLANEVLMLDLLTMTCSRLRTTRTSSCPQHAVQHAVRAQAAAVSSANIEISFDSLEQAHMAGFDVIDIREPHELTELPSGDPRASSRPMAQLLQSEPAFVPRGKTLLVCATGRRSLAAAQELRERGLNEVYSLRGGVKALQARLAT
jgi:adenylyltransferase/sulfurtransferase